MAHAVQGLLLESTLSGAAGGEISPNLLSCTWFPESVAKRFKPCYENVWWQKW